MKSKSEKTKDILIEATLQIIVRGGFEGVSLSEIVKETGLNRALVKYHFGSKENLVQAVTEEILNHGRTYTQDSLQKRTESDLIERYVRTTFDWVRTYPLHMNFLLLCIQRGYYDTFARGKVEETFKNARIGIAQFLLVHPKLTEDTRRALAIEIHSMLMGCIMNLFYGGKGKLDQFEERAVNACRAIVQMNVN